MNNWLKPVRLKDVIPLVNGVFSHISDEEYVFKCDVTKQQLDYLLMASFANKTVAPVVDLLHDDERAQLTNEQLTSLASMLLGYYKPKWDKLGNIYDIKYDPIHNYLDEWEDSSDEENSKSIEDDKTDTTTMNYGVQHTNTRTDNLVEREDRALTSDNLRTNNTSEATQYGKTDTETLNLSEQTTYNSQNQRTDNLTKQNTGTQGTVGTDNNTNSIWGFNSGAAVNSDSSSGGNSSTRTDNLTETDTGTVTDVKSGSDTVGKTGTDTHKLSGTDTTTNTGTISDAGSEGGYVSTSNTGTQTNNGSDNTTGTNTRVIDDDQSESGETHRDREGKHFGNIGNLTSQKMIEEEIELWKWNYIQSILNDARDFLTIQVYM